MPSTASFRSTSSARRGTRRGSTPRPSSSKASTGGGWGANLGSITEGKLADIIVLDQNVLEVPVNQLHETGVRMTIMNGTVVYEAE